MTILILGGTAEARALATELVRAGYDPLSSLAGRVARPARPDGRVRSGGFGGVAGLARFLTEHRITLVVDATHPFAAQISEHARLASEVSRTPLLRLERPGWENHPDANRWTWVADETTARDAAEDSHRPFLTTGRQSLATFLPWADRAVLTRVVDPPTDPLPPAWTVIRARGPYERSAELQLMRSHGVDALITKDSGGPLTAAKLDAARDLGVPVTIIERPHRPTGVPTCTSLAAALTAIRRAGFTHPPNAASDVARS